jgi:diguanylate cyclase (GGDEF)-like protein
MKCLHTGILLDHKPTVLIADDEKINLKILSEILKSEVELILTKSGEQVIDKASKFKPDLILLDIIMPKMDGFSVIKNLKSNINTHHIPVIFITALTDVNNEEKGFNLGASDYIQKPFHAVCVLARVRLHLQLARQRALLAQLAYVDSLTTLANRRKYDEVFDLELISAKRDQTHFSLAVIDIDFFKQYNDSYGHFLGDQVLQKVAKALADALQRPRDFIARTGGEEFVIILPNTDLDGAGKIIAECCQAVSDLKIVNCKKGEIDNPPVNYITVSAGGFSCVPEKSLIKSDIYNHADNMLYKAKSLGRNCQQWQDHSNLALLSVPLP